MTATLQESRASKAASRRFRWRFFPRGQDVDDLRQETSGGLCHSDDFKAVKKRVAEFMAAGFNTLRP